MTVEQMRVAIISTYPTSLKWTNRVNKMSDTQVIAIYKRFLADGKIK